MSTLVPGGQCLLTQASREAETFAYKSCSFSTWGSLGACYLAIWSLLDSRLCRAPVEHGLAVLLRRVLYTVLTGLPVVLWARLGSMLCLWSSGAFKGGDWVRPLSWPLTRLKVFARGRRSHICEQLAAVRAGCWRNASGLKANMDSKEGQG